MNLRAIETEIKRVPFQPFSIVTSSGDRYEVRHPENAMITKTGLVVGIYDENEGGIPDHYTTISYLHISALEPIKEKRGRSKRAG